MKKLLTLLVCIFIINGLKAQVNLCPNPNFSIHDSCPQDPSMITYAIPWFRPTLPVRNTQNDGTPDYYNTCFTTSHPFSSIMGIPQNFIGHQNSINNSGGYAGLFAYDACNSCNYREYIEAKLDSSLISGHKYFVKFYVSMADSCHYATDEMGLYFSTDSVLSNNYHALPYIPQVSNQIGNFLSDKLNWTLIQGTYVAQGGEQFITIGNFNDEANLDTLFISGGGVSSIDYKSSYYYIGYVCISSDSLACNNLLNVPDIEKESQIEIFPNPTKNNVFIINKTYDLVTINLFDMLGNIVYINKSPPSSKIAIDLSSYEDGLYLFKLNSNKININKKIIVIKK